MKQKIKTVWGIFGKFSIFSVFFQKLFEKSEFNPAGLIRLFLVDKITMTTQVSTTAIFL